MSTWVLHRGALGDSVLLWPLLRALRSRGPVTLASDWSKARLAARFVGVEARFVAPPIANMVPIEYDQRRRGGSVRIGRPSRVLATPAALR